jgi:hypothetical protein
MILHPGKVFLLANYVENGDLAVRKSEASVRICIDLAGRLFVGRVVSYTSKQGSVIGKENICFLIFKPGSSG